MTDTAPPQLGDIPQHSEINIPTLSSTGNGGATHPTANGNQSVENTKNAVYSSEVWLLHIPFNTQKLMLTTLICSLSSNSRDYLQQLLMRTLDASAAMNNLSNHPYTQNVKNTVANGQ